MRQQFFLYFAIIYAPLSGSAVITLLTTFQESFNTSLETIALVIPFYIIPFALIQLFSGALADAFSKKKVLIIGMLFFGFASILIAFASSIEELLLARFIQGFFAAFQIPIIIAIIGDSADDSNRGKAFGTLTIFIGLGLALGPLIGGLMDVYFSWQLFFLVIGLLAILNAIGLVFLSYSDSSQSHKAKFSVLGGIKLTLKNIRQALAYRQVWILMFGGMFGFVGMASTFIYLPIYLSELSYTQEIAGLAVSFTGLSGIVIGTTSGKSVDKFGRKPTLYFGFIIIITSLIIFAFIFPNAPNIYFAFILMGLLGVGFSFNQAAINTMATEVISDLRATVASISSSFRFIGLAAAPLLISVYLVYGFSMIMLVGLVLVIMAMIVFIPFKTLEVQTTSISKEIED